MKYYYLKHKYEPGAFFCFRSVLKHEEVESLCGYIQFRLEELSNINQGFDVSELGNILIALIETFPLDKKFEEVKDWCVIDLYTCRENKCGEKFNEWYAKIPEDLKIDLVCLDDLILLSEAYESFKNEV